MNSPFANLFLSLQNTISSLADGGGKKYIPFVDQDLGQLENHNGDNRPPVSWPCCLIDIDMAQYSQLTENNQKGDLQVIFRLGFPPFSSTGVSTPQLYKEKALAYYDLEQVLYLALQGKHPEYIVSSEDVLEDVFGSFNRINGQTEQRSDFIRVRIITYKISFTDYSAQYPTTFRPASLNLTEQLTETI